jgi:hypothetical protein
MGTDGKSVGRLTVIPAKPFAFEGYFEAGGNSGVTEWSWSLTHAPDQDPATALSPGLVQMAKDVGLTGSTGWNISVAT